MPSLRYERMSAIAWAVWHPVHGPLGIIVRHRVQRPRSVRVDWWVYRGCDPAPTGQPARSRAEAGLRLLYWWERLRVDQVERPPHVDPRPLRRHVTIATSELDALRRQLEKLAAGLEVEPPHGLARQVV